MVFNSEYVKEIFLKCFKYSCEITKRGEYCVVNFSLFVLVMEDDLDQNFSWDWGCLT